MKARCNDDCFWLESVIDRNRYTSVRRFWRIALPDRPEHGSLSVSTEGTRRVSIGCSYRRVSSSLCSLPPVLFRSTKIIKTPWLRLREYTRLGLRVSKQAARRCFSAARVHQERVGLWGSVVGRLRNYARKTRTKERTVHMFVPEKFYGAAWPAEGERSLTSIKPSKSCPARQLDGLILLFNARPLFTLVPYRTVFYSPIFSCSPLGRVLMRSLQRIGVRLRFRRGYGLDRSRWTNADYHSLPKQN